MTMIQEEGATLDEVATVAYAHLFQAFAEPTRLAIVQHLASGEHRVRDLVEHMGLAQSTVSKHLSFLVECHLIQARPEGRATWYSLTRPHELAALIAAAERILHATGTDAVLLPEAFEGGAVVADVAVREGVRALHAIGVVDSRVGAGAAGGTVITAVPTEALNRFLRMHVALAQFSLLDVVDESFAR